MSSSSSEDSKDSSFLLGVGGFARLYQKWAYDHWIIAPILLAFLIMYIVGAIHILDEDIDRFSTFDGFALIAGTTIMCCVTILLASGITIGTGGRLIEYIRTRQ